MMAMTPYEKKTLEEIESAFFEAVETRRVAPSAQVAKMMKKQPVKTAPPRRSWFGGLKEKVVMTFVCCAPPQTLLDDDEIQEILAKIEEPAKPSSALPPRAPSRKDSLLRRNSASVMPASRAVDSAPSALEKPSLSDITHVLDRSKQSIDEEEVAPVAKVEELVPRAHVSLAAMQRVVVALLALHKAAEKRQTERAVLAVQMKWRRRQPVLTAPIATAPATPSASPLTPTTTTATEPDFEPKTDDHAATTATTTSPMSPKRRRDRKSRASKKTKFAAIPHAVTQETARAVESLTQLALTRKRLRSVDLESRAPCVDVERDVHVLFGDEEIDDDEDDEVVELAMKGRVAQPAPCCALQRCASVPPPPTAFRPRPVKTKTLLESQAATTIQCAWRGMKSRQEREIRRRLAKYEAQKQSVMPTIRNKMLELRKRLEEMQERHTGAVVAVVAPEPVAVVAPAPVDDDYDWL